MHILMLFVMLSFSLSTAPLEQDLTIMTVPSWHQQNAQEGSKHHEVKTHNRFRELQTFDAGKRFRESVSLVTLSLQPPPGFQIQDLQSKSSHPHLLHPLQGWDLENGFISEALK